MHRKIFYILIYLVVVLIIFLFPKQGFSQLIYRVNIEGEIDLGLAPFISRVLDEAKNGQIDAVIFEINTFGGRLDSAVQIRDSILNSNVMTIAYINKRAISAGALISLACNRIVMAKGSTIGAATPVTINPLNPLDNKVKPASEKIISYFRNEMAATAESNGRPSKIAEAMVDPDIFIENVSEAGKLLTLTSTEASRLGISDYVISNGINDILAEFHLEGSRIIDKQSNWAEKLLRLLTGSILSSLLLSLGLIGLVMEFRTPTWGVAGTFGIICLALFFWGHFAVNLVGWEEIALLSIGIILIALEAFVIPGFGITGISGIACIMIGLTLSLLGKHPTSRQIWQALSQVAIAISISIVIIIVSLKSLSQTAMAKKFVLQKVTNKSPDLPGVSVGLVGIAQSNLRPAGIGEFNNQRLNIVSEGDYIPAHTKIIISYISGNKILVKPYEKGDK